MLLSLNNTSIVDEMTGLQVVIELDVIEWL